MSANDTGDHCDYEWPTLLKATQHVANAEQKAALSRLPARGKGMCHPNGKLPDIRL